MDLYIYHRVLGSFCMSDQMHKPVPKSQHEHKTLESYIVGFMLSLIFTFIPYYMVINQTVSGTALILTILGFALLQMLVQVIFFLHLGRGPKPFYNVGFFIATVGIILIVTVGSVVIINNLHYNKLSTDQVKRLVNDESIYQVGGQKTGACQGQHANHAVTIKNGKVSPFRTLALKCDTMTFINEDKISHVISFGTEYSHQIYAGLSEISLRKGLSKTITLSDTGTYQFHDQAHIETDGSFTVVP